MRIWTKSFEELEAHELEIVWKKGVLGCKDPFSIMNINKISVGNISIKLDASGMLFLEFIHNISKPDLVLLKKSIKQLYVRFIAHVLEQVLTNV
jgi:hypothetical protein